jgi:hypothetical protein
VEGGRGGRDSSASRENAEKRNSLPRLGPIAIQSSPREERVGRCTGIKATGMKGPAGGDRYNVGAGKNVGVRGSVDYSTVQYSTVPLFLHVHQILSEPLSTTGIGPTARSGQVCVRRLQDKLSPWLGDRCLSPPSLSPPPASAASAPPPSGAFTAAKEP